MVEKPQGPPEGGEGSETRREAKRAAALALWEEGNERQRGGDLAGARDCYERSIQVQPTAEAHTFLGWLLSMEGKLDEAIRHCRTAIALDPDFGNPYNDIGVYLMKQGKLEEASLWLTRATLAPRYDPRHFPHMNLARIHLAQGKPGKALRSFREALRIMPADPQALAAVRDLTRKLN